MRTVRATDRGEWRAWLAANHGEADEVWLVLPTRAAGEASVTYNDAVEEALCFGWIDSTNRTLDDTHQARRFTPRKAGSPYSQPNIERLRWLDARGMLMPEVRESVAALIEQQFEFPQDILDAIRADGERTWRNFESFGEPYRRIRVAYVDAARGRPEEFGRRLANLVAKTRDGKVIRGYGGVDKYYR